MLAGRVGWVDVDAYPGAVPEPGLMVYRFDAPLFFLNADHFRERVELASQPGSPELPCLSSQFPTGALG